MAWRPCFDVAALLCRSPVFVRLSMAAESFFVFFSFQDDTWTWQKKPGDMKVVTRAGAASRFCPLLVSLVCVWAGVFDGRGERRARSCARRSFRDFPVCVLTCAFARVVVVVLYIYIYIFGCFSGNAENILTVITYDNGGEWHALQAPNVSASGKPFGCLGMQVYVT